MLIKKLKNNLNNVSVGGLVGGLVLYSQAVRPSLLPRELIVHIILSVLFFLIGYGIGLIIEKIARKIAKKSSPVYAIKWASLLLGVSLIIVILVNFIARSWQTEQIYALGLVGSPPNVVAMTVGFIIGLCAALAIISLALWFIHFIAKILDKK